MTTAAFQRRETLSHKDLKGWPRGVATAILAIVNSRGVKVRLIDGKHLMLYPPDRDQRPVKFSASKPEEDNIKFLQLFVDNHLGPPPTAERPAKPEELAPLLKLSTRPPEPRSAPDDALTTSAPVWRPHTHSKSGKPTIFETDGTRYRCTVDGCSWINGNARLMGVHAGNHAQEGKFDPRPISTGTPDDLPTVEPGKIPLSPARVQELRARAGLSWVDLARRVGVSDPAIRMWLARGTTEARVAQLAEGLGVSVETLTGSEPLPNDLSDPPEPKPEPEPEAPAIVRRDEQATALEGRVMPTNARQQDAAFREIIRTALAAIGEPDPYTEIARLRRELDDEKAKLDLLRETLRMLDSDD